MNRETGAFSAEVPSIKYESQSKNLLPFAESLAGRIALIGTADKSLPTLERYSTLKSDFISSSRSFVGSRSNISQSLTLHGNGLVRPPIRT